MSRAAKLDEPKLDEQLIKEAEIGNLSGVEVLIESGADINATDEVKQTALMKAVINQHQDISSFLIEKGADLDRQDCFKNTALMYTVLGAQEDLFKQMLLNGASPSIQDARGDKVSDLLYRCYQLSTKENKLAYQRMMTEFIPDFVHLEQQRSLMIAIVNGHDGAVALLCENEEVDVNEPDGAGLVPLHWAAAFNREKAAFCLIKSGANIDYQDKNGMTALMYAAKNGHLGMVKLLLEEGAQIALANKERETASSLAYLNHKEDVFEYLKKESLIRIVQKTELECQNSQNERTRE